MQKTTRLFTAQKIKAYTEGKVTGAIQDAVDSEMESVSDSVDELIAELEEEDDLLDAAALACAVFEGEAGDIAAEAACGDLFSGAEAEIGQELDAAYALSSTMQIARDLFSSYDQFESARAYVAMFGEVRTDVAAVVKVSLTRLGPADVTAEKYSSPSSTTTTTTG